MRQSLPTNPTARPATPICAALFMAFTMVTTSGCILFDDTTVPTPPDLDVADQEVAADLPPDLGRGDPDLDETGEVDLGPPDLDIDLIACPNPLPIEVCDDCLDNDCDNEIDEAGCASARLLEVSTGDDAIEVGHALSLTFDHGALVAAGESRDDGRDVQVWFFESPLYGRIHRVLDPQSAWNQSDTRIWFQARDPVARRSTQTRYLITLSPEPASPVPLSDERSVFTFADFFDRDDSGALDRDWVENESVGQIRISSGGLEFTDTQNLDNRPVAEHDFAAVTDPVAWRIGFNWARTGPESSYRVHLQLGASDEMEEPPTSPSLATAGVGPSLVWGSPNQGLTDHEGLGIEDDGIITQATIVSGLVHLEAIVDPFTRRYDLYVDGVEVATNAAFSTSQTSLDRLRLLTWQLTTASFDPRRFEYVILRPWVAEEPSVRTITLEGGCE